MRERNVPSAVARSIIIKFLTREIVTPIVQITGTFHQ